MLVKAKIVKKLGVNLKVATFFYPKVIDTFFPELHLDDGYPDPRLAPLKEFYLAYRGQLTRSGLYQKFGAYDNPAGSGYYKETLSNYLNLTRG